MVAVLEEAARRAARDVEALHHHVVGLDLDGVRAALDPRAHPAGGQADDPDRLRRRARLRPAHGGVIRVPVDLDDVTRTGGRHRLADLGHRPRRPDLVGRRVRRCAGQKDPQRRRCEDTPHRRLS